MDLAAGLDQNHRGPCSRVSGAPGGPADHQASQRRRRSTPDPRLSQPGSAASSARTDCAPFVRGCPRRRDDAKLPSGRPVQKLPAVHCSDAHMASTTAPMPVLTSSDSARIRETVCSSCVSRSARICTVTSTGYTAVALEAPAFVKNHLAAEAGIKRAVRRAVDPIRDIAKDFARLDRHALRLRGRRVTGTRRGEFLARLPDDVAKVFVGLGARSIKREAQLGVLLPIKVRGEIDDALQLILRLLQRRRLDRCPRRFSRHGLFARAHWRSSDCAPSRRRSTAGLAARQRQSRT